MGVYLKYSPKYGQLTVASDIFLVAAVGGWCFFADNGYTTANYVPQPLKRYRVEQTNS